MTSETRIRVMIVDDHAIVREGIAQVLEQSGEFEVVGQAGDGEEAVGQVRELRPDVVIMDILMPVKDGIEACREIAAALPETRVLMLTASNKHSAIVDAVNAGATGYLQKYSGKEMLLSTVREVAGGGVPGAGRGGQETCCRYGRRARPGPAQRPEPADGPGAGYTPDVCPGDVLRGDSRGAGQQQPHDGAERGLRDTAQAGGGDPAGAGGLGGPQRPAERRRLAVKRKPRGLLPGMPSPSLKRRGPSLKRRWPLATPYLIVVARSLPGYTSKTNLITKVLDFVRFGGPILTIGRTVFEMWLGAP